jgi:hypothetical protein
MSQITVTPLERIRKVYKDKVDSYEKFSLGALRKKEKDQNKELNRENVENDENELEQLVEDVEITAEQLKSKRDKNYQNPGISARNNDLVKINSEFQYRIRGSGKSVEVDNM